MKPYIFLDRDGTINIEKDYLYKIEDFEFEKASVEGLKHLQEKGYGLIIVTNQSGIARQYYTMDDVQRLHEYMQMQLSEAGVCIEKIYVCPHGPNDNCECRKPKLGLYYQAIEEFNIDVSRSYLVGDRLRDIIPAKQLGARGALVQTGHSGAEDLSTIEKESIFENLLAFAKVIPYV